MKAIKFCDDYFNHYKNWILNHLFFNYKSLSKYLYFSGMYINPKSLYNISNDDFFLLILSKIVPDALASQAKDFLEYYKENENLVRQTSKFYRDNLPHMIKVAIIGHKIMNLKFSIYNNKRIIDYFMEITGYSEMLLLKIWFLAALFHDLCYPSIILSQPIGFKLKDIIDNSTKFEVGNSTLKLIDYKHFFKDLKPYVKNEKVMKKLRQYVNDGHTTDHGVYSSYMLYRAAKMENINEPTSLNIIMNACRVILFHTCFEKINWEREYFCIRDYPLDFYLYLIDKSHECGRKVLNKKTPNEVNLINIIKFQDLKYNDKRIISEYSFLDKTTLKNAEFEYRKHKLDKINAVNKRIVFLKMFNKKNFRFPELKFIYNYVDYLEDENITEEGYLY